MAGFTDGFLALDQSTYTTTSGDNNDIVITSPMLFVSTTNNSDTITGIVTDGFDSYLVFVSNMSASNNLIIKNNSSLSTAAYRVFTFDGNNFRIPPKGTVTLQYDVTNACWRLINFVNSTSNPTYNSSPGRSLSTTGANNTFTINNSRNARVTYTINFAAALILTTSNGSVTLDYSLDAGANWTTVASVSQVFTVSITISTNTDNGLSGEIPPGALVRIYRRTNTNCTVTLSSQQEVTY